MCGIDQILYYVLQVVDICVNVAGIKLEWDPRKKDRY